MKSSRSTLVFAQLLIVLYLFYYISSHLRDAYIANLYVMPLQAQVDFLEHAG